MIKSTFYKTNKPKSNINSFRKNLLLNIYFLTFLFKFSHAKYFLASVGGLGRTIEIVFIGWAYNVLVGKFEVVCCGGEAGLGGSLDPSCY